MRRSRPICVRNPISGFLVALCARRGFELLSVAEFESDQIEKVRSGFPLGFFVLRGFSKLSMMLSRNRVGHLSSDYFLGAPGPSFGRARNDRSRGTLVVNIQVRPGGARCPTTRPAIRPNRPPVARSGAAPNPMSTRSRAHCAEPPILGIGVLRRRLRTGPALLSAGQPGGRRGRHDGSDRLDRRRRDRLRPRMADLRGAVALRRRYDPAHGGGAAAAIAGRTSGASAGAPDRHEPLISHALVADLARRAPRRRRNRRRGLTQAIGRGRLSKARRGGSAGPTLEPERRTRPAASAFRLGLGPPPLTPLSPSWAASYSSSRRRFEGAHAWPPSLPTLFEGAHAGAVAPYPSAYSGLIGPGRRSPGPFLPPRAP